MELEQRLSTFLDKKPSIHGTAYIAPGAVIVGDVTLEEESSVWFNAVVRGDINQIRIGPRSNVQDGSVIHLADDYPAILGEYVTCGHNCILHACEIGDEVLIGMGATILDGAIIGARSIVGANALVTMGTKIPAGSLVIGSPAKVARMLDEKEQQSVKAWAEKVRRSRPQVQGKKRNRLTPDKRRGPRLPVRSGLRAVYVEVGVIL